MSRARRLSEIAKSNEPAFSGNQWWLADPSAKSETPQSEPVAEPVAVAAPRLDAAQGAVDQHVPVPLAIAASRIESIAEDSRTPASPAHTESVKEEIACANPSDLMARLSALGQRLLIFSRKNHGTAEN